MDQLFYALEQKEALLAKTMAEKNELQEEILTTRALTARGGNYEPKFVEVHHNRDISDDSDSDDEEDEQDRE